MGTTTITATIDSHSIRSDLDSAELETREVRMPCLIVLRGMIPGSIFHLAMGRNRIGRAIENECRLTERSISRFHTEILVESESVVLVTDLGSSNGTFLNSHRLAGQTPIAISEGDRLRLGAVTLLKFAWLDRGEERFRNELFDRSFQDKLTGLANREYLLGRIADTFSRYQSRGMGIAVLMLDIDALRNINEEHGYDCGNEVLQTCSSVIREQLSPESMASRYGGEEFVILFPAISQDEAHRQAEYLRYCLSQRVYQGEKGNYQVGVSAGLAFAHSPPSWDVLMSAADVGLFQAKSQGGDRTVCSSIDASSILIA